MAGYFIQTCEIRNRPYVTQKLGLRSREGGTSWARNNL